MSNTQNDPPVYVPRASVKEKVFTSGHSILKVGLHVETTCAFLKEHANEKGFINLNIAKRREVGKYGDTHTLMLDIWKPDGQAPARHAESRVTQPAKQSPAVTSKPIMEDDVPF